MTALTAPPTIPIVDVPSATHRTICRRPAPAAAPFAAPQIRQWYRYTRQPQSLEQLATISCGGEEVGVALEVALDHGGSELLIRKYVIAAARDDGLDERVLVSPVQERIEAVERHEGESKRGNRCESIGAEGAAEHLSSQRRKKTAVAGARFGEIEPQRPYGR